MVPLLASGILLAGCVTPVPFCAGAASQPPHIGVDAQGWHNAHPGGTIHACYDGTCDREDGTTDTVEIVVPQADADGRKHDLTVTITDATGTTVSSERIALVRVPGLHGGPCPLPDRWSRAVLVRNDGTLQVGGADDGSIIVPTP
ncbi:MAG: hypothetical protein AAGC66_09435 [Leifsonia sp.]